MLGASCRSLARSKLSFCLELLEAVEGWRCLKDTGGWELGGQELRWPCSEPVLALGLNWPGQPQIRGRGKEGSPTSLYPSLITLTSLAPAQTLPSSHIGALADPKFSLCFSAPCTPMAS